MKIAATATQTRPARSLFAQAQPPIGLDELGRAQFVLAPPRTDADWLSLLDRVPAGGHLLAARLVACLSREHDANAALVKGLAAVGERRRSGQDVPASWLDRLGDLAVEEYDAVCCLDDVVHAAAPICPAWVEVPPGERAVPPEEVSWIRTSRLIARAVQAIPGDGWNDGVFDALALDPLRGEPDAADVARIREACREAVRGAITATYSNQETR